MYAPVFNKLLEVSELFTGKEDNLYLLACRDLPRLLRHSKKSVSKDISEQPLKTYITTICYVSLLITSAFRRYHLVTKNSSQERFSFYPWHSSLLPGDELIIKKRKTVPSSAPFVSEVIHWLVDNPKIWRWLYNEPSWVDSMYRECLSGGDSGLILGTGIVFFDDPFSDFVFSNNADSIEPAAPIQAPAESHSEKPLEQGTSDPGSSLLDSVSDDDLDLNELIAQESQKNNSAPLDENEIAEINDRESVDIGHEFASFLQNKSNS